MSRNRITRRRGSKGRITAMDGREISPEEAERRRAEMMEQGGVFIDLYPATDDNPATMNIALSGPALEADAAQHGMDVDSYMEKIWQETLGRERASEKGKKQP
jgi:hypothetical protein